MKRKQFYGFSLVEVVLALGLVAFGLITLLALLPVGMNSVRESTDERIAMSILTGVEADIRNVPPGQTDSPIYGIPVWSDNSTDTTDKGSKYLDQHGQLVATSQDAFYILAWTAHRPAPASGNPQRIHLRVSWPGQAAEATGSLETLVAIAR